MDGKTIQTILSPILTKRTSAVVAISTVNIKSSNIFNKIMHSELFDKYPVTFICEDCVSKGIRDICKHKRDEVPDYSGGNTSLIKSLFEGNVDTYSAESLGVMLEEGKNCFNQNTVMKIIQDPRVELTPPIRYIYVCVDPCVGSDVADKRTSDFAIVTICDPFTTIIGMDALDVVCIADYENPLISHIRRLKEHPLMTNAMIVLDCESGTGTTADDVERIVRGNFRNDKICVLSDFKHRKSGTLTTWNAKLEMMNMTRVLLDSHHIRIWNGLVTSNEMPERMINEFIDQFLNYERVVKPASSVHTGAKVTFSGKANGKLRDDLCMTLQRAIRARHRFLFSGVYDRYHI